MSDEVEKLRHKQYVAEQQLRSCRHREKILERQMSELNRRERVHRLCTRDGDSNYRQSNKLPRKT